MIHNPKQIEFAENLIIKLFPDQFTRPLSNIDRQTVEYLCNNYQTLKFRRILKAVELAWSENLVPGTFITTNTRPVIQNVSHPSPIGRLVQSNPAPGSPNPFNPSPKNIGNQTVQIHLSPQDNITSNMKAPRAKRSAPSLGPQTCSALFKKRKEQIENSTNRNTDPDRFLIPHQTPNQLTKTKQGQTTNTSPVLSQPVISNTTNTNHKPLSMASLPTGLLENIEKITKNSNINNTAQNIPTPNKISKNESSIDDAVLTIDINKPGSSGVNTSKSIQKSNVNTAVVEIGKKESLKPIAKSNPTKSRKSPSTAIVRSSVELPNIMDTIAGGKRISVNTNIPPSLFDIRRAMSDDKPSSENAKNKVESQTTQKYQPDKSVIDKIIGDRSKSDKSKVDCELQNILNDVNGKLETAVSTDSSSTDSGNETIPSSSSLLPSRNLTSDPYNESKPRKISEEKITRSGIEISSSIQVLDSDEEDEVQTNRENVKRNIRRVLAETDGVVTINDSDDEHSSDEKSHSNKNSKNNNHKSDTNHLDDLLDTDQENDVSDPSEDENEPESKREKSVSKKKRNKTRSFVRSGYDLVKSRSRKKSSDIKSITSKKNKPSTKIVPVTIIPPPTPPRVDEETPPRQDEGGNFVVKKILKTRRSKNNGTEYKCRYEGFTEDDDEWVTFDVMEGTEKQKKKLIADYEKRKLRKKNKS